MMDRGENKSKTDVERPKNCGECRRFYPNPGDKTGETGWCDEFPAAGLLKRDVVCNPNVGRLKRVDGDAHNDKTKE